MAALVIAADQCSKWTQRFLVAWLQNRGIESGLREKQDDFKQHEEDLKRAKGMQLISAGNCKA